MEIVAFVAFFVLVVGWLALPGSAATHAARPAELLPAGEDRAPQPQRELVRSVA